MSKEEYREVRSFLMARDPSVDRRFRPCPERQVRLFDDIHEDESSESQQSTNIDHINNTTDDNYSLQSDADGSSGTDIDNGALVYLRLRPVDAISVSYKVPNAGNVIVMCPPAETSSTSNNRNTIEKHYSFSAIFDGKVNQREVYEKCIGNKIESDTSFTVMTYGTSGSGKTFTLLGNEQHPGIIPRALENIFNLHAKNIYTKPYLKLENATHAVLDDAKMAKELQLCKRIFGDCADAVNAEYTKLQQNISNDHDFQTIEQAGVSIFIWISFAEIYNEMVFDLLDPPKTVPNVSMAAPTRKNLKIVGNDGNVFIKGLTSVFVKTSMEAFQLLRYGQQRVTYASTSVNTNSSRSHCIFFVDILKYCEPSITTQTSYKFCDLAGSERANKTGNTGSRLKEAQRINTSLMVLGRCLDAAGGARKRSNDVMPIRDSKLTMLLQPALLGKEKLSMIVNVTPTDRYYEENMNALGFSAIAKNIICKPAVIKHNKSRFSFLMDRTKMDMANSSIAQKKYIEELLQDNLQLQSEVENLNIDLDSLNMEMEALKAQNQIDLLQQEQSLRNKLVDSFQAKLREKEQQFEYRLQQERENLHREYEAKISGLQRKHQEELEDLRDEIEEQKENNSDVICEEAAKKRRTMN